MNRPRAILRVMRAFEHRANNLGIPSSDLPFGEVCASQFIAGLETLGLLNLDPVDQFSVKRKPAQRKPAKSKKRRWA